MLVEHFPINRKRQLRLNRHRSGDLRRVQSVTCCPAGVFAAHSVVDGLSRTIQNTTSGLEGLFRLIQNTTSGLEVLFRLIQNTTSGLEVLLRLIQNTTSGLEVLFRLSQKTTSGPEVLLQLSQKTTSGLEVVLRLSQNTTSTLEVLFRLSQNTMESVEVVFWIVRRTSESGETGLWNTAGTGETGGLESRIGGRRSGHLFVVFLIVIGALKRGGLGASRSLANHAGDSVMHGDTTRREEDEDEGDEEGEHAAGLTPHAGDSVMHGTPFPPRRFPHPHPPFALLADGQLRGAERRTSNGQGRARRG